MMRTFKAENGNTITALDDTQADAMIKGGLTEVFEDDDSKTSKKSNTRKTAKSGGDNDEIK